MRSAIAGRSATKSAYVARGIRAIASWSRTYGITDEEMPTPMPAASATGSPNAGAACASPTGETTTKATSIAAASPSTPPTTPCRATRCASTMYAANSAAFAAANATPSGSPESCTPVRRYTPPAAATTAAWLRAVRAPTSASTIGPANDGRDSGERQQVDRDVEARVHHGEHRAERGDEAPPAPVERAQHVHGRAPEREDGRRRGDPQPGDAEHVHAREEQHRERRPEVVEDRAAGEVGVWRGPSHGPILPGTVGVGRARRSR